jgi:predicted MFS family arabinose efflux permease
VFNAVPLSKVKLYYMQQHAMSAVTRFLPRRLQQPDLLLIYVNVALYALCFQMQQPAQLALVKSLVEGDDAKQQFAWVKSVNGVAQLGGSLLSGVLIDRMGCNGVMLLSLFASVLSYGLVATATNVSHLYLAQLPTVFQHAVLAARAYVSITLDDSERAEYL